MSDEVGPSRAVWSGQPPPPGAGLEGRPGGLRPTPVVIELSKAARTGSQADTALSGSEMQARPSGGSGYPFYVTDPPVSGLSEAVSANQSHLSAAIQRQEAQERHVVPNPYFATHEAGSAPPAKGLMVEPKDSRFVVLERRALGAHSRERVAKVAPMPQVAEPAPVTPPSAPIAVADCQSPTSHKKLSPAELQRIRINQASEYYRKQREAQAERERLRVVEQEEQQRQVEMEQQQRQEQRRMLTEPRTPGQHIMLHAPPALPSHQGDGYSDLLLPSGGPEMAHASVIPAENPYFSGGDMLQPNSGLEQYQPPTSHYAHLPANPDMFQPQSLGGPSGAACAPSPPFPHNTLEVPSLGLTNAPATVNHRLTKEFSQHWIVVGKDMRTLLLDFNGSFTLLIPNVDNGQAFRVNSVTLEIQTRSLKNGQKLTFMKFFFESPKAEFIAPVLQDRNMGYKVLKQNSACVFIGRILDEIGATTTNVPSSSNSSSLHPMPHQSASTFAQQPSVSSCTGLGPIIRQVHETVDGGHEAELLIAPPPQHLQVVHHDVSAKYNTSYGANSVAMSNPPRFPRPDNVSVNPSMPLLMTDSPIAGPMGWESPGQFSETPSSQPTPPPVSAPSNLVPEWTSSPESKVEQPGPSEASRARGVQCNNKDTSQCSPSKDQSCESTPATASPLPAYPALKGEELLKLTVCRFCERQFKYVSELLLHMKIHVMDVAKVAEMSLKIWVQGRRLKCNICKKKTSYTLDYAKHKDEHEVPGLLCPHCSVSCKSPLVLSSHMESHHSSELFLTGKSSTSPIQPTPAKSEKPNTIEAKEPSKTVPDDRESYGLAKDPAVQTEEKAEPTKVDSPLEPSPIAPEAPANEQVGKKRSPEMPILDFEDVLENEPNAKVNNELPIICERLVESEQRPSVNTPTTLEADNLSDENRVCEATSPKYKPSEPSFNSINTPERSLISDLESLVTEVALSSQPSDLEGVSDEPDQVLSVLRSNDQVEKPESSEVSEEDPTETQSPDRDEALNREDQFWAPTASNPVRGSETEEKWGDSFQDQLKDDNEAGQKQILESRNVSDNVEDQEAAEKVESLEVWDKLEDEEVAHDEGKQKHREVTSEVLDGENLSRERPTERPEVAEKPPKLSYVPDVEERFDSHSDSKPVQAHDGFKIEGHLEDPNVLEKTTVHEAPDEERKEEAGRASEDEPRESQDEALKQERNVEGPALEAFDASPCALNRPSSTLSDLYEGPMSPMSNTSDSQSGQLFDRVLNEDDDFELKLSDGSNSEDEPERHVCLKCGDEFATPTSLKIHTTKCKHARNESLQCTQCMDCFMSPTSLKMHQIMCQRKQKLQTLGCNVTKDQSPSLEEEPPSSPSQIEKDGGSRDNLSPQADEMPSIPILKASSPTKEEEIADESREEPERETDTRTPTTTPPPIVSGDVNLNSLAVGTDPGSLSPTRTVFNPLWKPSDWSPKGAAESKSVVNVNASFKARSPRIKLRTSSLSSSSEEGKERTPHAPKLLIRRKALTTTVPDVEEPLKALNYDTILYENSGGIKLKLKKNAPMSKCPSIPPASLNTTKATFPLADEAVGPTKTIPTLAQPEKKVAPLKLSLLMSNTKDSQPPPALANANSKKPPKRKSPRAPQAEPPLKKRVKRNAETVEAKLDVPLKLRISLKPNNLKATSPTTTQSQRVQPLKMRLKPPPIPVVQAKEPVRPKIVPRLIRTISVDGPAPTTCTVEPRLPKPNDCRRVPKLILRTNSIPKPPAKPRKHLTPYAIRVKVPNLLERPIQRREPRRARPSLSDHLHALACSVRLQGIPFQVVNESDEEESPGLLCLRCSDYNTIQAHGSKVRRVLPPSRRRGQKRDCSSHSIKVVAPPSPPALTLDSAENGMAPKGRSLAFLLRQIDNCSRKSNPNQSRSTSAVSSEMDAISVERFHLNNECGVVRGGNGGSEGDISSNDVEEDEGSSSGMCLGRLSSLFNVVASLRETQDIVREVLDDLVGSIVLSEKSLDEPPNSPQSAYATFQCIRVPKVVPPNPNKRVLKRSGSGLDGRDYTKRRKRRTKTVEKLIIRTLLPSQSSPTTDTSLDSAQVCEDSPQDGLNQDGDCVSVCQRVLDDIVCEVATREKKVPPLTIPASLLNVKKRLRAKKPVGVPPLVDDTPLVVPPLKIRLPEPSSLPGKFRRNPLAAKRLRVNPLKRLTLPGPRSSKIKSLLEISESSGGSSSSVQEQEIIAKAIDDIVNMDDDPIEDAHPMASPKKPLKSGKREMWICDDRKSPAPKTSQPQILVSHPPVFAKKSRIHLSPTAPQIPDAPSSDLSEGEERHRNSSSSSSSSSPRFLARKSTCVPSEHVEELHPTVPGLRWNKQGLVLTPEVFHVIDNLFESEVQKLADSSANEEMGTDDDMRMDLRDQSNPLPESHIIVSGWLADLLNSIVAREPPSLLNTQRPSGKSKEPASNLSSAISRPHHASIRSLILDMISVVVESVEESHVNRSRSSSSKSSESSGVESQLEPSAIYSDSLCLPQRFSYDSPSILGGFSSSSGHEIDSSTDCPGLSDAETISSLPTGAFDPTYECQESTRSRPGQSPTPSTRGQGRKKSSPSNSGSPFSRQGYTKRRRRKKKTPLDQLLANTRRKYRNLAFQRGSRGQVVPDESRLRDELFSDSETPPPTSNCLGFGANLPADPRELQPEMFVQDEFEPIEEDSSSSTSQAGSAELPTQYTNSSRQRRITDTLTEKKSLGLSTRVRNMAHKDSTTHQDDKL